MEKLKHGYKQTDIGIIPEDWEVVTIGELCSISIGQDVVFNKFSSIFNSEYPYPVYSNTVGNYGLYGFYKIPQYSGNAVTVVGRGIGLGTAFARYCQFGAVGRLIVLNQKKYFNPTYLSSYINSQIEIFSESGGIPQLTGISFSKYLIALPSKNVEQTAIATALSDTDALIAALDKKIAKKQQIKQGAMQQLLTGKKRLPGFSGEWVEKKLGEISKSINSGKYKFESTIGSYPVYGSTGIISTSNKYEYNNIKILVARVGANAGKINLVSGKFSVTDNTLIVELLENINYSFINYLLIKKELNKFVFGSGQPLITGSQLKEIELFIPNSTEEQTAIAQILTDMDHEIAQLEKERDKYKDLKAGMMQVLLTGRVRLE